MQHDENNKIFERVNGPSNRKSSLHKLLELYILVGFLIFLVSIVLFVAKKLEDSLSFQERGFAILGLSGLSLSVGAYIILNYRRRMQDATNASDDFLVLVFLREWNNFERLADDISAGRKEIRSVGQKIDFLLAQNLISEVDAAILLSSLQIRNRIVHSSDKITFDKGEFLIKNLADIMTAIKKKATEP